MKNEILHHVEDIPIDSEYMIAMRIKQSNQCSYDDIIVVFIYMPPEGSDYSNPDSIFEQTHKHT